MAKYSAKGTAYFTIAYCVDFNYEGIDADSESDAMDIAKRMVDEEGYMNYRDSDLDGVDIYFDEILCDGAPPDAENIRCDKTHDMFD